MSAEFLGHSGVLQGAVSGAPFTASYTLPAGTSERVLIVAIMLESGNTIVGDVSVQYGGVALAVNGTVRAEQFTILLAAVSVSGQTFADSTLSIDVGAGDEIITAQAFVFDRVLPADGDMSFALDGSTTSGASITVSETPEALGDLMFSFAIKTSIAGPGLALSGDDAAEYTRVDPDDVGDFVGLVATNKGGRCAYSANVSGQQMLTWTQDSSPSIGALIVVMRQGTAAPPVTAPNCTFETDADARQLSDLREELAAACGYAAVAANLPPTIETLANSYLQRAQKFLYRRYTQLETTRYFTWQLKQGERFYDLPDNIDADGAPTKLVLDRYTPVRAYAIDDGGWWWPLIWKIPGTFYTFDQEFGWPTHIQINRCIEIFPAPTSDDYQLAIRGRFGLMPFTADTDYATVDSNLVLWWAIGMWQTDRGKTGSARLHFGMVKTHVQDLVAGSHGGRRYIPRSRAHTPVPTPPIMTEFDS